MEVEVRKCGEETPRGDASDASACRAYPNKPSLSVAAITPSSLASQASSSSLFLAATSSFTLAFRDAFSSVGLLDQPSICQ